MNYLAHVYLSGSDDCILAGNFMGDFVKGNDWKTLPVGLGNGVVIHRLIDSYTDEHPISSDLRSHLRPVTGKYSGIALDMIYDHLLASNWCQYAEGDLEQFSCSIYERLEAFRHVMPQECLALFDAMKSTNWLYEYRTREGLDRALNGLDRRIGRRTGLSHVLEHVEMNIEVFKSGFNRFFPDIQRVCSKKLANFASLPNSVSKR